MSRPRFKRAREGLTKVPLWKRKLVNRRHEKIAKRSRQINRGK